MDLSVEITEQPTGNPVKEANTGGFNEAAITFGVIGWVVLFIALAVIVVIAIIWRRRHKQKDFALS